MVILARGEHIASVEDHPNPLERRPRIDIKIVGDTEEILVFDGEARTTLLAFLAREAESPPPLAST